MGTPVESHITIDQLINSVDPAFTDITSVNATSDQGIFLVEAIMSGKMNANCTPRIRVQLDGVTQSGLGCYGPSVNVGAGGEGNAVVRKIVRTSAGAHAFKLQGAFNGAAGGYTIHANTNPNVETATLVVTPFNAGDLLPLDNSLNADVTVNTVDPTFQDLFTVTKTIPVGTRRALLSAVFTGFTNSDHVTPRIRMLIDGQRIIDQGSTGTPDDGAYGSLQNFGPSATLQAAHEVVVQGIAPGSHTFTLQACYNGATGFTIHANTNPTLEQANLIIVPQSC